MAMPTWMGGLDKISASKGRSALKRRQWVERWSRPTIMLQTPKKKLNSSSNQPGKTNLPVVPAPYELGGREAERLPEGEADKRKPFQQSRVPVK